MREIVHCNILDDPAQALIYSTNVMLNCSGGVGGALMERYGPHVQDELHQSIRARGLRSAAQGEVLDLVPAGLPYRHLIHTTPTDGMYETTATIVEDVLRRSLDICAADPAVHRVAVSALATGYGHLQLEDFLSIAEKVFLDPCYVRLPEIVLCLESSFSFETAQNFMKSRTALGARNPD